MSTRRVRFISSAADAATFDVTVLRGVETLGRPYRFELELASKTPDADIDKLLREAARLEIDRPMTFKDGAKGFHKMPVHGVLSEFEQQDKGGDGIVRYRAVLVPRLWRASLARRTRIYMGKTVPEIIEALLKENGLGARGTDYDFNTRASYAKDEYVVQYGESDLDFIHRLMEQEGLYYHFEQAEESEKAVFADGTHAYVPLAGEPEVRYRQPEAKRAEGEEHNEVVSFRCAKSPIPAEVLLKDYNWRTPTLPLKVTQPTKGTPAFGTWYEYGEHYKDDAEGKRYASLRAEEWFCRQTRFSGESDVRAMSAGRTFDLKQHYREDFNRGYFVTEVRHEASQESENVTGKSGPRYRNSFVAIASDVVFRPARVTPAPVVHGTLNAKVDAAGTGDYAEVDDLGRYKVQIPFDLSGEKDGKASRYVRMAQPYSGADMGMHFPLHKGVEVVIGHTNGDPDRPIILASVPNQDTVSPVTGQNQSQSKIKTGGGNKMTIEDQDGQKAIKFFSPQGNTQFNMGRVTKPRL